MKFELFVVIRVGLQDGVNPVEEVEKIIATNDFCWFGKYGEPLNQTLQSRVAEKKDVMLCLVYKSLHGYNISSYKIEEVSKRPMLLAGSYPDYYSKFIDRIGTFIKISKVKSEHPTIDDLYVKSSLNKLSLALRDSMRGHFVCKSNRV